MMPKKVFLYVSSFNSHFTRYVFYFTGKEAKMPDVQLHMECRESWVTGAHAPTEGGRPRTRLSLPQAHTTSQPGPHHHPLPASSPLCPWPRRSFPSAREGRAFYWQVILQGFPHTGRGGGTHFRTCPLLTTSPATSFCSFLWMCSAPSHHRAFSGWLSGLESSCFYWIACGISPSAETESSIHAFNIICLVYDSPQHLVPGTSWGLVKWPRLYMFPDSCSRNSAATPQLGTLPTPPCNFGFLWNSMLSFTTVQLKARGTRY